MVSVTFPIDGPASGAHPLRVQLQHCSTCCSRRVRARLILHRCELAVASCLSLGKGNGYIACVQLLQLLPSRYANRTCVPRYWHLTNKN